MLSNGRNNVKEKLTPEAHRRVGQLLRPLVTWSQPSLPGDIGVVLSPRARKQGVGGTPSRYGAQSSH